ncbi:hypothetical protein [uncultured Gimesia sp.]|jgi:hypothetical protein|uniref:hypothetical protein n=1 Tax=uncultured Gimesia sp. TaxID=1678688 RepID=UPI002632451B|nr:hypothetical protein [uncultured Gimesia sp.]
MAQKRNADSERATCLIVTLTKVHPQSKKLPTCRILANQSGFLGLRAAESPQLIHNPRCFYKTLCSQNGTELLQDQKKLQKQSKTALKTRFETCLPFVKPIQITGSINCC